MVQITADPQLIERASEQSSRAVKQRLLLQWMCQHLGEVFSPQQICDEAGVSISVLEAVIDKGAAQFIQEEVFRDPFTKEVSRTQALQLTDEQQVALQAITTAMDQRIAQTFITWCNRKWQNRGLFAGHSKGTRRRKRSHYART